MNLDWIPCWNKKRKIEIVAKHRRKVITSLLEHVFPDEVPFYYDVAFSFLQPGLLDVINPIRVDLFLPDYPLAIDVLGPESYSDYRDARKYISQQSWLNNQEQLSLKRKKLLQYRCPYLIIWDYEAADPTSLSEAVKTILGFYPRSS